jgi:hypothetical protein
MSLSGNNIWSILILSTLRQVPLLGVLAWMGAAAAAGDVSVATPNPARSERSFAYTHDTVPEVPWSIHIFRLARTDHDFEFCTTLGNGDALGLTTVSEQIRHIPTDWGEPVAAVNGDLYNNHENYRGDPRDLQISQGEVVSAPTGHDCFWVDAAGNPQATNVNSAFRIIWPDGTTTPVGLNEERIRDAAVLYTRAIGASTRTRDGLEIVLERGTNALWLPLRVGQHYVARVREVRPAGDSGLSVATTVLSLGPALAQRTPKLQPGDQIQIVTETVPDLTGVRVAIGGGPMLVRDGKAMHWGGIQVRHPRSALGWNRDHFFLVEVDGRQNQLSVGMTFSEFAEYLHKLGCEQAMNLDGGGSATLWVMGNVMNSPSEGQERPGANSLVVVRKHGARRSPIQVSAEPR